jgi:hypothetical protein
MRLNIYLNLKLNPENFNWFKLIKSIFILSNQALTWFQNLILILWKSYTKPIKKKIKPNSNST